MRWRFAASTACSINAPVDTTLRELAQAGVRAVELAMLPHHFDPWRHEQVAEFAHCLRGLRLAPVAVHAPFGGLLDLSNPNPHHRHAAIGAVLSAAPALRDLGASNVVVHASDAARTPHEVDERLARAADSLRVLARACAYMDAQLLVETPSPGTVGSLAEEFARVMRPLDPAAGVCLDIGHATLGGQWDDLLGVVADRVRHVHAHDHHGSTDDHLPPGEGLVDWRHVRSSLAAAGRVTLGPRSKCVIIERKWGRPLVCNDGVTIVKEFELADHEENLGAQIIREAAERTGERVGDGTTTSTLLAAAIYAEGLRNIAAGASAIELKHGLDRALAAALDAIRALSRPVTEHTHRVQVATVSAHNDAGIGSMVADAIERVGLEGTTAVEEAKGTETSVDLPGAGLALLRAEDALAALAASLDGDARTGVHILRRALEVPTRQIAENSGADGGVVVDRMRGGTGAFGFDASTGHYVDLIETGIIDPTKVVRTALENAVSAAGILLLTEATLTEVPEPGRDERPAADAA